MLSRRAFLQSAALSSDPRPNVIFILADDLGYGDLGVTGNRDVPTPHLDSLARDGLRFTQFYTASPICSPSRTGFLTGQCPSRHRITSYLSDRKHNRTLAMPDWLDPQAPSVARAFQNAGYRTAHIGKWHLGGGRDVGDAPLPQAYGFHESVTSFEGLGPRILSIEDGDLSKQSAALGNGPVQWAPKHRLTELYLDRSIDFITRNQSNPFYLHLWPCDVHDAHHPNPNLLAKYAAFSANPYQQRFYAVLDEFDRQLGRLFQTLHQLNLAHNTLIAFTGDNGPTAWPRYYREGHLPPGATAGLRGRKWSLYEGGIRQPLLLRWPRRIPSGRVDQSTVASAVDLFPTLAALANVPLPNAQFDGENLSQSFLGRPQSRKKNLFWDYGRRQPTPAPGAPDDQSPTLAIRRRNWKLLQNEDRSHTELYNLAADPNERRNLAPAQPQLTRRLSSELHAWRASLPPGA